MFCFLLYIRTVLKVLYVLISIIYQNCSVGVVCFVFYYILELFCRCCMFCFLLYIRPVLKVMHVLFSIIY